MAFILNEAVLRQSGERGPPSNSLPLPAFQTRSPQAGGAQNRRIFPTMERDDFYDARLVGHHANQVYDYSEAKAFNVLRIPVADSSKGLADAMQLGLGNAEGDRHTTQMVAIDVSVGDDLFEGDEEDSTPGWLQQSSTATSSTVPTMSRVGVRNDVRIGEIPRQLLEQPVTALMVHYIPSRQSQRSLMLEWPHRTMSSDGYNYNLLYVPYNVRQRRISGYAFLNFETYSDALHFASRVHGGSVGTTSGKQLIVSAAARQGVSANVIHWHSTLQQVTNPAFLPVVFVDGDRVDFWAYANQLQAECEQEIAPAERMSLERRRIERMQL